MRCGGPGRLSESAVTTRRSTSVAWLLVFVCASAYAFVERECDGNDGRNLFSRNSRRTFVQGQGKHCEAVHCARKKSCLQIRRSITAAVGMDGVPIPTVVEAVRRDTGRHAFHSTITPFGTVATLLRPRSDTGLRGARSYIVVWPVGVDSPRLCRCARVGRLSRTACCRCPSGFTYICTLS